MSTAPSDLQYSSDLAFISFGTNRTRQLHNATIDSTTSTGRPTSLPRTLAWPTSASYPNHHLDQQATMYTAYNQINGAPRATADVYNPPHADASYDINSLLQQQYQMHQRVASGAFTAADVHGTDAYYAAQQYSLAAPLAGSGSQEAYPQSHYAYQSQPPHQPSSITEHILGPQSHSPVTPTATQPQPTRSTLCFSGLEPWMDVEYFNQVCCMMRWENVILKVPHVNGMEFGKPGSNSPNNPGFCFLTFSTPAVATTVLNQLGPQGSPTTMPNSKRPFQVSWATVPASSARSSGARSDSRNQDIVNAAALFVPGNLSLLNPYNPPTTEEVAANGRQQEYSIFVGDLAPETTNSDLIAVFRDPILGLRHDREPKFVAPFTSCRSAKIMVDPVLGVSKGYGFVRFGTASDSNRALIEMQGLYCLSRPMRISQATAKARPQGFPVPQGHNSTPPHPYTPQFEQEFQYGGDPTRIGTPGSRSDTAPPLNGRALVSPAGSTSSTASPVQRPDTHQNADPLEALPTDTLNALQSLNIDRDTLSQLLKIARVKPQENGDEQRPPSGQQQRGHNASRSYSQSAQGTSPAAGKGLPGPQQSQSSSTHQRAQARALLANMIGSTTGVTNSTDPYNTTVFVGGLSGLISEETLRTFFGPFGDIHYVKIPPGKGCGFVQFVRKADAELAIEKMQGFPIGGGRVRLSWGRSQSDKAAQAAAQAAQLGLNIGQLGSLQGLSEPHTAQLLQTLGLPTNDATGISSAGTDVEQKSQPTNLYGHNMSFAYDQGGYRGSGAKSTYTSPEQSGPEGISSDIPRSHTFPSFAPFESESGSYDDLTNANSSHAVTSVAGERSPRNFDDGAFTITPSASRNLGRADSFQPGIGGYHSFDGQSQGSPSYLRAPNGFRVSDLLRQERAGSDSTAATTTTSASETTPPPQHGNTAEVFDLGNHFANLSFGDSISEQFRQAEVRRPYGLYAVQGQKQQSHINKQ